MAGGFLDAYFSIDRRRVDARARRPQPIGSGVLALLAVALPVLLATWLGHTPASSAPAPTPALAASVVVLPLGSLRVAASAPAALFEGDRVVAVPLGISAANTPVPRDEPAITRPTPTAAVPAATVHAAATPSAALSVQPAGVASGTRFVDRAGLQRALAASPWPSEAWPSVTRIALCEAGVDSDHDGAYDLIDTRAVGPGGPYLGALQIGASHATPGVDLLSLADNLAVGYRLYAEAGGFSPWGCPP